jgi:hypothetical protein
MGPSYILLWAINPVFKNRIAVINTIVAKQLRESITLSFI